MKLRHFLSELEKIRLTKGEELFEKLQEYDFTVNVINTEGKMIEQTQRIGIYIDGIADEVQFIAYVNTPKVENDTLIM